MQFSYCAVCGGRIDGAPGLQLVDHRLMCATCLRAEGGETDFALERTIRGLLKRAPPPAAPVPRQRLLMRRFR